MSDHPWCHQLEGATKSKQTASAATAAANNKEDDIEVGRIQLTTGDAAPTLIHSLEVIREDRKVAGAVK